VRRVEDIAETLWGTRVSSSTGLAPQPKLYRNIEALRNREITGEFPYIYLDGVVLKRSWEVQCLRQPGGRRLGIKTNQQALGQLSRYDRQDEATAQGLAEVRAGKLLRPPLPLAQHPRHINPAAQNSG
jgi:hypothetical protein